MAFIRGGGGVVLVDNSGGTPVDLTCFVDTVEWGAMTVETLETSTFCPPSPVVDAQNPKTYIAGQTDGTVSIGGKWDSGATGPDDTLRPQLGAVAHTLEWRPTGTGIGKESHKVEAILTSYTVSVPVGDVVKWEAAWQASGPFQVSVQ